MTKLERIRLVLPFFAAHLSHCEVCPRKCGVDRGKGRTGFCRIDGLRIYTWFLHKGEEPPISGSRGSGTIFFSGCNLQCAFCQNHRFSSQPAGNIYTIKECATIMLELQEKGAHNINLVTPTHVLPYVVPALEQALENGLDIPIVYNSSGYDLPEVIEKLEGIVDVYMPDLKYIDPQTANRYSQASDYPRLSAAALSVMKNQVQGPAIFDDDGIMTRGMIIRHLVLPGHAQESMAALKWIKDTCAEDALLSLMSQFQPYHHAMEFPELSRRLTREEYRLVVEKARELDLDGWIQDDPDESLAGVYFEKKENL